MIFSEEAFNKGEQQTNVLIAGHMYVINFAELVQYQQNGFSKRRKIKKERISKVESRKGTAGVPVNDVDLNLLQ